MSVPLTQHDTRLSEKFSEKAHDEHIETVEVLDVQPVSAFADLPRLKALKVFWKVAFFCVAVAWAAIMDGFCITIPGSIVANKYFIAQFGTIIVNGKLTLDARYVGAFTGVQSAGQIIGMLSGPLTSDRFGRKFNLALLTVMLSIGIVVEMVAKSPPVWLVARLFAGWGTGLAQSTIPVYISEVAPSQLRGGLLATYNFWFGVGQFAGAIALQIVTKLVGYKQVIYSQWVFVGIMIPIFIIVPETPYYYVNKGDEVGAKKSLNRLYGSATGYDVDHEYSVVNWEHKRQMELAQASSAASYGDIFKGTNLRRTWVAFLPLEYQQLAGLSFILSYTTYFFDLAGLKNPFLGNVIVKTMQLTAQLISFFTIERIGRRRLLIFWGVVMTLVNLIIAILGTVRISSIPGGVLIALFSIWAWSFASSAGPIGWAYTAEVTNPRLRAKTAGFASACTAGSGLLFNFVTPLMLSPQEAGWALKTGYLFFAMSAIGVVLMYFTVPEVTGRTFDDLNELFERKIPARKFASTKVDRHLTEQERAEGA